MKSTTFSRMLIAVVAAAALAVAVSPGSHAAGSYTAGRFVLEIDGKAVGSFLDASVVSGSMVLSGGTGSAGLQTWALSQKRCDPDVVMYSTSGTPVARYHLENAWPSKLEIGGLVASKNEVAIESLALSAEAIRRDVPAATYQKQCDQDIAST